VSVRIDHVVTSGVFSLDGDDFDVDNNIWIIGDDDQVVVIDAAHDHRPILDAIGGRKVLGIVCSHAHNLPTLLAHRSCCTPTIPSCGKWCIRTGGSTIRSPTATSSLWQVSG
jgi:hypothetical protein